MSDLKVINAASLVLALIIALNGPQPLRVALGLPFILFFPGYCLIRALFPKRSDLNAIERIALSFGLSIAVVPLIGLALNYTPWGIRLTPILVSLLALIAAMSLLAFYRSQRLPAGERYEPRLQLPRPKWRELSRVDQVLTFILVGAVIFALASIAYVISMPKVGERFTEFYILGTGGKAEGYPRDLKNGESGAVILGIVNHEYAVVTYRVRVKSGQESLASLGPIKLRHEEKYEERLEFTPQAAGENQKVEFLLDKLGEDPPPPPGEGQASAGQGADGAAPYRSLHLWVNVRP